MHAGGRVVEMMTGGWCGWVCGCVRYSPSVVYPKRTSKQLYVNLVKQCEDLGIQVPQRKSPKPCCPFAGPGSSLALLAGCLSALQVIETMPEEVDGQFVAVVDAMLGFGATGPLRPPFDHMIHKLAASQSRTPVISVDIPSGWDVEEGDVHGESSDLTEKPGADAWIDSSARLCGVCLVATGFHPAALVSLTAPKRCARLYKVGGADLQAGRQGCLTWPCCCLLCWCW